MKEFVSCLFSGIIGVLLTICYQHFLAPEPAIIVNVEGIETKITRESYENLSTENVILHSQYDKLIEQNTKYCNDLKQTQSELNELQLKLNATPDFNYNDLSLSIDGEEIAISKNNSMVIINGKDYFSKEILEKLVTENKNISIKNNTLFIGDVILDKANLFDQFINDGYGSEIINIGTDSYGNTHSNVLHFDGKSYHNITFVLNEKYSFLKFSVAAKNGAIGNGNIIIKADDVIVYTSDSINKRTKPFTKDIPINNCSLLTIEYTSDLGTNCIIYNATVHN